MDLKPKRCLILTVNTIQTVKVKRIIDECEGIKTIYFNLKEISRKNYISPKPGQFTMIWVPGVDEIPMSISSCNSDGTWSITVKNVGECTNALYDLNVGDFIGVRGPLGNHFEYSDKDIKKIFLIAGGIGIAPIKFLASELYKLEYKITIIEGAKVSTKLLFLNDFQTFNDEVSEVFYCTDDGSYGLKELASDTFERLIRDYPKEELSSVIAYACGPEMMIYKTFQTCIKYKINFQASLERIMRCGCGLCGLCAIDPLGLLVCKDGPIFNSEVLRKMEDFGKYKRDFTGKKIKID